MFRTILVGALALTTPAVAQDRTFVMPDPPTRIELHNMDIDLVMGDVVMPPTRLGVGAVMVPRVVHVPGRLTTGAVTQSGRPVQAGRVAPGGCVPSSTDFPC